MLGPSVAKLRRPSWARASRAFPLAVEALPRCIAAVRDDVLAAECIALRDTALQAAAHSMAMSRSAIVAATGWGVPPQACLAISLLGTVH